MASEIESATDHARRLFNEAINFKLVMSKGKISFKLDVCGHKYLVDAPPDMIANKNGTEAIWFNLFKEFEKDLDAGVHERKERLDQGL